MQKVFFFHNPKAAGTSIIKSLRNSVREGKESPHVEHTVWEYMALKRDYSNFMGYDLYIGHYTRHCYDAVKDGHVYVTNFRNPVSRVISLYNFFRYIVPNQEFVEGMDINSMDCVTAAASLEFEDFINCRNPYVMSYISDHHFRQLTASQWIYEDRPKATIAEACDFIDGALCYYVCEYEEASLRWMKQELNLQDLTYENTTRDLPQSVKEADISDKARQTILDINQRDLAIYHHAVKRLLERQQQWAAADSSRQDP